MKKKVATFRMTKGMNLSLKNIAIEQKRSISNVIRLAVDQYIKNYLIEKEMTASSANQRAASHFVRRERSKK